MKTILAGIGFLMVLAVPKAALADEAPTFDGQSMVLTIPRVDTAEAPGKFENVRLKLAKDGRWELLSGAEAGTAPVDSLEIGVVGGKPVQVFATVTGALPSACYELGPADVRRSLQTFELRVRQRLLETFVACAQVLVPFKKTIPLDTFGLPAGNYRVVAGRFSQSFTLAEDNNFPTQ